MVHSKRSANNKEKLIKASSTKLNLAEIRYCCHSGIGNALLYNINGVVLYLLIKQCMLEVLKGESRHIELK